LAVFSETWPSSGTTRNGQAYAQPTSAPRTDDSGCSYWQPEPIPLTVNSAWMAGLFEGEGYISVRRDTKRPRILMGLMMTDQDVVRRFAGLVNLGTVRGPYAQKGLGTKPTWRWTITTTAGVEQTLNLLWDGLCSRRRAKAIAGMTECLRGYQPTDDQPSLLPTPDASMGNGGRMRSQEAIDSGAHQIDLNSLPRLLATPRASRGASGTETMYALGGERTDEDRPRGEVLLPTPNAADGMGGPGNSGRDGGLNLRTAAALLPTPTSQLEHDSQTHRSGARTDELLLGGIALAASRGDLTSQPSADGNES
jgi:hypothetical protein